MRFQVSQGNAHTDAPGSVGHHESRPHVRMSSSQLIQPFWDARLSVYRRLAVRRVLILNNPPAMITWMLRVPRRCILKSFCSTVVK